MPFESSVLAAFGAMLFWGIGDFFIQRATRKFGNIESLAFIGIIGALGLFPFVMNELPLLFTVNNLVFLSFIGIVTFVAVMFDFEALKEGKLSVVEVLLEVELPITAILGYVFFKETLSFSELGIFSMIFIGIVLISITSISPGQLFRKIEKGALFAILAAIGMALVNFLTALGSKSVSPLMVIWVPWVVLAFISLFFVSRRNGVTNLFRDAVRFKFLVLGMGILDTLAWLFYATALLENKLAITTAITESYPAIAIMLGVFVNKEKIMLHQYAGAAIALAASFMLVI